MSAVITLSDLLGDEDFVETARGRLEIRGLGIGEVLKLVRRHKVLVDVEGKVSISVEALIEEAPDAVPEIISIAAGMPGPKGRKAAMKFTVEDQANILHAILERTMPEGPAPFIEALGKLMRLFKGG